MFSPNARARERNNCHMCNVVGHGHASTHSVHLRYARYAIYCSAEQMAEGTQYRNIGIERTATKSPGNWCWPALVSVYVCVRAVYFKFILIFNLIFMPFGLQPFIWLRCAPRLPMCLCVCVCV